MTTTPPDVPISDSWVDLSGQLSQSTSPLRVTPVPFGGEQDYLRMLREAQRESSRSSNKVSPISSAIMSLSSTCRNTPSQSPKSPPNSPNPELATCADDFRGVYINRMKEGGHSGQAMTSDQIWDWTSQPNIHPKDWKYSGPNGSGSSNRSRKSSSSSKPSTNGSVAPKKKSFSKEVLLTLALTNLLSFIIGAGIGIWLSKRGGGDNLIEIRI